MLQAKCCPPSSNIVQKVVEILHDERVHTVRRVSCPMPGGVGTRGALGGIREASFGRVFKYVKRDAEAEEWQ